MALTKEATHFTYEFCGIETNVAYLPETGFLYDLTNYLDLSGNLIVHGLCEHCEGYDIEGLEFSGYWAKSNLFATVLFYLATLKKEEFESELVHRIATTIENDATKQSTHHIAASLERNAIFLRANTRRVLNGGALTNDCLLAAFAYYLGDDWKSYFDPSFTGLLDTSSLYFQEMASKRPGWTLAQSLESDPNWLYIEADGTCIYGLEALMDYISADRSCFQA